MKKSAFLVTFAVCFAAFLAYIAAILAVKGASMALGLILLVLMPLFTLCVSFFGAARVYKGCRKAPPAVLCPLCSLAAAGLLHLAADKIVNGFTFELSSALFDLALIVVCAAGGFAAVRISDMREKRDKKRRRFDD